MRQAIKKSWKLSVNYALHSLHVDNSPEIEQYKAISGEALKNGGIFHACNLNPAFLI